MGLLLVLLGGCATVGPDYEPPDDAWLESLEVSVYGEAITVSQASELTLSTWWQQFDDPTLDNLISIARQENPGLRIAGLRVLEARALAAAAGASLYPQVQTLNADAVAAKRSSGVGESGFRTWSAGASIGWELDFWGRFERAIESADSAYFASVASQRDAQILLSATVAELYWQYRVVQERVVILNKNAKQQERSFDITRQMFEAGQQSELDLQQARTQYLATLSSLPALEQAAAQLKNALSALLGRSPGNLPELEGAVADLPADHRVQLDQMPAVTVQRRPDVRAALWSVAAQSAQIGIAEAEYYPAVAIGGSLGWSGNSLPAVDSVGTLGVGPAVRWTVFDWGRIANTVRVQDARLQQTLEGYRGAVLNAAREINDASIALDKTAEQRVLLEETVAASERALDIATTRYREGYADFQRVLDAQRVVFAQADRKLQNDGQHLSAIVALYQALGGGWSADDLDTMLPADTLQQMRERSDWGDLLSVPVVDREGPVDAASISNEEPTP
ncbi:MAG: TolC family protein [Cellvibrionales bacterium]|jgi:NodT family efflux transporter outer membrane factor (OMF) lipoprotein